MKTIDDYELPPLKIVGPSCYRVDTKPLDYQSLGLEERRMILTACGSMARLEYPTILVELSNGKVIEIYDIPEADKEKIFRQLYVFENLPSLDEIRLDIHSCKEFYIRDFLVTREGEGNFLVSPYYPESGGTVLDWIDSTNKDNGVHVCRFRRPQS